MIRSIRAGLAALCAATILSAGPAWAAAESFAACDGYGTPTDSGDGMTAPANTGPLGIFAPLGSAGNMRANTPDFGAAGIAACTDALVDNRLKPQHALRKVSLIRARAMHRLGLKDYSGAEADLQLAEATGQSVADSFYDRSMQLGIKLIRAWSLREQGDQAGAETLAMEAWAQRPYSRQVAAAVLMAMGPKASLEARDKVSLRAATLTPEAVDSLYQQAFRDRRFELALRLYSQLSPPRIGQMGLGRPTGAVQIRMLQRAESELFIAERGGQNAYALAATGRGAEGLKLIADARLRLQMATAESDNAAAQAGSQANPDQAFGRRAARIIKVRGDQTIDRWEQVVKLRTSIGEGRYEPALAALRANGFPRDAIGEDLILSLLTVIPQERAADRSWAEQVLAEFQTRPATSGPGISALFGALPEVETAKRVAGYGKQDILFGTGDGYWVGKRITDGTTIVHFKGRRGSGAIVEEMALFRAADLARQAGKPGFAVVDRDDVQLTVTTTYYGMSLRSDPDGYETWLFILTADPAAYVDAPWRFIDANEVYEQFAPFYGSKAQRVAAKP